MSYLHHKCLLCIGSNCEAELHLKKAEKTLDSIFPNIRWGKAVCTPSEGNGRKGCDYLNRIASLETAMTEKEVTELMKTIERKNGRTPADKETGLVPLDIDLLQYDSQILKPLDFEKEYIRKAMRAFAETS